MPGPAESEPFDRGLAETREQRWREQAGLEEDSLFRARLALVGLDRDRFLRLLVESPESLYKRCPRPPWLDPLERCWSRTGTGPGMPLGPVESSPQGAFLNLLRPLLDQAYDELNRRVRELAAQCEGPPPFDPETVGSLLVGKLPGLLLLRISRVLNLELRIASLEGTLPGESPEDRFASFVEALNDAGTASELLERHPVLARSTLRWIEQWRETRLELLERLTADRRHLAETFHAGQDLGRLIGLEAEISDRHAGGRTVAILGFASGVKIVYKPRCLETEARFQELLSWLGDFRTLRVLDRGGYGWMEHVEPEPCRSREEIRRFYRRQGALLALFYLLDATDLHHENLIACGEHPVFVDLETLFQPVVPGEEELVDETQFATGTVLRSGLLPRPVRGSGTPVDLSGLGARRGQKTRLHAVEHAGTDRMRHVMKSAEIDTGSHLPAGEEDSRDAAVWRFAEDVVGGFRETYETLHRRRGELLEAGSPLRRLAETEMRVLLRSTELYVRLRFASGHPDVTPDGLAQDRLFDRLWRGARRNPAMAPVVEAELAALHRGDVPRFILFPTRRDLQADEGARWQEFFAESGGARVERRLGEMGSTDLERQTYLVRQALRSLRPADSFGPRERHELPEAAQPTGARELRAEALAVGERLERLQVSYGGRSSWFQLTLGADLVRRFEPVGADLYHGFSGLALFFAHLARLTGEDRFHDLARQSLDGIERRAHRSPERLSQIGAYEGWGGPIYALAHLGSLWREPVLWDQAERLVPRVEERLPEDRTLDVIGGSAGALAALLALYRHRPARRVLDAAVACGLHLLEHGQRSDRGLGWPIPAGGELPLTGFAHGTAGIAWALSGLAQVTGDERFADAAKAALEYERSWFSPEKSNWPDLRDDRRSFGEPIFHHAWCHGAPGIGMGRLGMLEHAEDPQAEEALRREIRAAAESTLQKGFGESHCLCHGDLGNLDFLVGAARALGDEDLQAQTQELTGRVLASLRTGWRCGVAPGGEPPGLMTGLAGIGYGLLRLATPERVPSVLLLESPPDADALH